MTCVSCPGKVFIAGGYLVLDAVYTGLIIATASRFYTVVRQASSSGAGFRLRVSSPQFEQATWVYECVASRDGKDCVLQQTNKGPKNPFIHITVEETCRMLLALLGSLPSVKLDVFVVGDNDFYSQERDSQKQSRKAFQKLGCRLADVHKTGLGSSAAMVTSLVGALLAHFKVDVVRQRALLHNLAQYAHSLAQGKIGSGFDVSTAVYGTQCYRRFDPSCLPDLSAANEMTAQHLLTALDPTRNAVWLDRSQAGSVEPFGLPPMTALVLADVDAGSNTPSMVSKVLAWRKANPEQADSLWSDISTSNQQLATEFLGLQSRFDRYPQEYAEAIQQIIAGGGEDEPISHSLQGLLNIRKTIDAIRHGMRSMGQAAQVPIEPPAQTSLLDYLSRQRGVLGGGVPGAGGFDAVWILVLAPDDILIDEVEHAMAGYGEGKVRPLSKAARMYGPRGDIRGERRGGSCGIQVEDPSGIEGLADLLRLS